MVRPERELLNPALLSSTRASSAAAVTASRARQPSASIAVERLPNGRLGRVRLDLAEVPNGVNRLAFARDVIAPGTEIHTDGAWVPTRSSDHGFSSPHSGLPRH